METFVVHQLGGPFYVMFLATLLSLEQDVGNPTQLHSKSQIILNLTFNIAK